MIIKFNEYIERLNEGLIKTTDINITVNNSHIVLSKLRISYNVNIIGNKIELKINDFYLINSIREVLDSIDSYFININGWFPSSMFLVNLHTNSRLFTYNKEYIIKRQDYLKDVIIYFESKFDIETDVPEKLYHLSIQNFEKGISKYGLVTKDKSKLSEHPDRIYVCKTIDDCKSLINQMKFHYSNLKIENPKNNINDKWIIYEIDASNIKKMYKDPNFNNGYYILNSIDPKYIKIVDKE